MLITTLWEFADATKELIVANQSALGLADVVYGDQAKIHVSPLCCVEPDIKDGSDIRAATRTVNQNHSLYVILYHAKVGSPQDNLRLSLKRAEEVEAKLHEHPRLERADGSHRVIHCYVTRVEAGYATKLDGVYRSTRLTFTALTQAQLPAPIS